MGVFVVVLGCLAVLGGIYFLSGPHPPRRYGGLVDMGGPKPKGSTGKWDDPPVDFNG